MGRAGSREVLAASAKALIEKNYLEKFSMEVLAGALFVNASYLHRTFKDQTGMTPLSYHHLVRCEKARELLSETDDSVGMIAWKVGFANTPHFTRIFTRTVGCTPSEYRRAGGEDTDFKRE